MQCQIKKLRDRENLRLLDRTDKTIVHIQLNKREQYVCFERFISKDKRNWKKLNGYLSLRDVWNILKEMKEKRELSLLTN